MSVYRFQVSSGFRVRTGHHSWEDENFCCSPFLNGGNFLNRAFRALRLTWQSPFNCPSFLNRTVCFGCCVNYSIHSGCCACCLTANSDETVCCFRIGCLFASFFTSLVIIKLCRFHRLLIGRVFPETGDLFSFVTAQNAFSCVRF